MVPKKNKMSKFDGQEEKKIADEIGVNSLRVTTVAKGT